MSLANSFARQIGRKAALSLSLAATLGLLAASPAPAQTAATAAATAPAVATAPATAAPADPALARNLAATCANCHGTNGNARGDMRPIAGMPADKLIAMLDDYRDGKLPATIMHQIAKGYTPEQVRLIAGYFAAQQPAK